MDRLTKAIQTARGTRADDGSRIGIVSGYSTENYMPVPEAQLINHKVVTSPGSSHFAASYYRMIRSNILRVMTANNWKTIGVTGPSTSNAKTLTMANLGLSIASVPDHSVLMVDADFRKNELSKIFGVSPRYGFEDILLGKAAFEEAVVCPGIDRVGLITSHHHDSASDLLMGKSLPDIMDHLRSAEQNVITLLDMPPTFVTDETLTLASHLDAVLLVVESGKTTREQLQASINLLKGVNILGHVLHNAPKEDCDIKDY